MWIPEVLDSRQNSIVILPWTWIFDWTWYLMIVEVFAQLALQCVGGSAHMIFFALCSSPLHCLKWCKEIKWKDPEGFAIVDLWHFLALILCFMWFFPPQYLELIFLAFLTNKTPHCTTCHSLTLSCLNSFCWNEGITVLRMRQKWRFKMAEFIKLWVRFGFISSFDLQMASGPIWSLLEAVELPKKCTKWQNG